MPNYYNHYGPSRTNAYAVKAVQPLDEALEDQDLTANDTHDAGGPDTLPIRGRTDHTLSGSGRDGATSPSDEDTMASARETGPTVSTGDCDFSPGYRGHRIGDIHDGGDSDGQESDTSRARPTTETIEAPQREQRAPWVAFACYAVAVVSLAVSLNTSWRFFDRVLHIPSTYGERYVMFAVAELALVVCGAGMAVNVHRDGQPGSFRVIVWTMCAAMAYMAWAESATEEAVGRILLGPMLGTVMLHLGLGLELRARHQHAGTVARISRELRERCLSRLGLADDGRDAAQRTRDRKAYAAATLSRPRRWLWSRQARLERALLAAGVADDEVMRDRMLARLAVIRHAHELSALDQPSPWHQRPAEPLPSPRPRAV